MALTIKLENENGHAIRTLQEGFDYDKLENINLNEFTLLKYVDFYGDTTFNTLQLVDLLNDFEKLKNLAPDQVDIIQDIQDLIRESQSLVHTYIKFYGD